MLDKPAITRADDAYKVLLEAIVDQRLAAGCRLTETALAQLMSCSRRHVEQALLRLAEHGLVTIRRNAGASVATPSYIEGREIYEVRRLLEVPIVAKVCAAHRPDGMRRLRANLDAEAKFQRAGDLRSAVRLSGEFHVLLAELSGSSELQAQVERLVARTSLVTQLYANTEGLGCWHHQHGDLLAAIERRDEERASRLMRDHLLELESALRVRAPRTRHHELERALR
jgi:DNA-binding GntR family transcriptional regulator